MATNYPNGYDDWSNPGPNTAENATGYEHDILHSDLIDATEAIEHELGINPSGSYSSVSARLNSRVVALGSNTQLIPINAWTEIEFSQAYGNASLFTSPKKFVTSVAGLWQVHGFWRHSYASGTAQRMLMKAEWYDSSNASLGVKGYSDAYAMYGAGVHLLAARLCNAGDYCIASGYNQTGAQQTILDAFFSFELIEAT